MKALLLSVLVIAACGKKADDKAAPAGTAMPGATPSPTADKPSAAGELAEADNPACKILPRADAEAWVGHSLDEYAGRAMPVGADCKHRAKKPFSSVTLILYTSNGADSMQKQKNAKLFGDAPVAIPGVGTEAVRSADGNQVGVVVGDRLAYAMQIGEKVTPDAAEKTARAIASHM